jgi:hypothetical protein
MATETETATGFACGMRGEERRSAPDTYRNSLPGRECEGDDDDDAMAVAKSLPGWTRAGFCDGSVSW